MYYFYGSPAYRIEEKQNPPKGGLLFPVTFIVKSEALENADIRAIYPFDTGAFIENILKDYIPKDDIDGIEEFSLGNSLENLPIVIETFFEKNINYLIGKGNYNLAFTIDDYLAELYYGLIQNNYKVSKSDDNLPADDRRYTIEIQSKNDLSIEEGLDILAVVLPPKLMNDSQLNKMILKDWDAEPLFYYSRSGSLDRIEELMQQKVTDFLLSNGYCDERD